MNKSEVATILGIEMAQRFSREIGLPAGNFWVPGIAVAIARDLNADQGVADVERRWRERLGLATRMQPA